MAEVPIQIGFLPHGSSPVCAPVEPRRAARAVTGKKALDGATLRARSSFGG